MRKLLLIEDNVVNVRLVERMLTRRQNWALIHAGQGQLGIEIAEVTAPDLILLDLHLPDMSGTELLQRLKGQIATASVAVVVLSGDASAGELGRLFALGAKGFMAKPVDVEELIGVLDSIGNARSVG